MKYAVEIGSGAMIYIPSFIKIGSGLQKLIGGRNTQTGWRLHTPTLRKKATKEEFSFALQQINRVNAERVDIFGRISECQLGTGCPE
jgi:hypothetical protein